MHWEGDVRMVRLIKSPSRPPDGVPYKITHDGIRSIHMPDITSVVSTSTQRASPPLRTLPSPTTTTTTTTVAQLTATPSTSPSSSHGHQTTVTNTGHNRPVLVSAAAAGGHKRRRDDSDTSTSIPPKAAPSQR
jgi:hypothetical protein